MKTIIKNLIQRKEVRFLIVGIINTAVGYGSYAILLSIGTQYLIANTIATIIGIINSYLWNRFFTFNSKNKALAEIARFFSVYLVSYCFSMLFLYLIVGHFNINTYLAGVLNIISTTIISWYGHKNFSFKDNNKI
ncbi:MAG: GtrA family protein [Candidatus Saccharibacteria bacterium]